MPHDPQRIAEARSWLVKAAEDLRAGVHGLVATPPLLGVVAFHCQQAAEKALKAILAWHDLPFRKTHDLGEIGLACARIDSSLTEVCQRADVLTVYAWIFRYPGDLDEPCAEDVDAALLTAREVFETVLARLPPEASP